MHFLPSHSPRNAASQPPPPNSIAKVNSNLLVAKCSPCFLILLLLDLLGASGSIDPLLLSGNSLLTSVMPLWWFFFPPPWLLLLCSCEVPSVCSHSLPWSSVLSPRCCILSLGDQALSLASGVFGRPLNFRPRSFFTIGVSWVVEIKSHFIPAGHKTLTKICRPVLMIVM